MVFVVAVLGAAAFVVGNLGHDRVGAVAARSSTSPASSPTTPSAPTSTAPPVPIRKLETSANPLVGPGVALPKVTCDLPKLGNAKEKLAPFYQALLTCLEQAWHPALTQVDQPRLPATVNVEDVKNSACGALPPPEQVSGIYCPDGMTIFMPWPRQLEGGVDLLVQLFLFGHEYGHHVQEQSGILAAHDWDADQADNDQAKILELSRRLELQADCFSAMFLAKAAGRGSISAALVSPIGKGQWTNEDSETHGSGKNATLWAQRGFRAKDNSACNTFAAPASEVS